MLCYKDVDSLNSASQSYTDTKNVVNASLKISDGKKFTNEKYWASTESSYTYTMAYFVDFYEGSLGYGDKASNYNTKHVRAVCAY